MPSIHSLAALLVAALAGTAAAADNGIDAGKHQFLSNCATCHGADGKGGSRQPNSLAAAPPDLTQLAKANAGVFPTARVYETIDGRLVVNSHGPRDMPVWGQVYTAQAASGTDNPYVAEAAVRRRIHSLIDYLYLIQER